MNKELSAMRPVFSALSWCLFSNRFTFLLFVTTFGAAMAESPVKINGLEANPSRILVKWKDPKKSDSNTKNHDAAPLDEATKDAILSKVEGAVAVNSFSVFPNLGYVELAPIPANSQKLQNKSKEASDLERSAILKTQIEDLQATGLFEYVEPDWIVSINRTPTDAKFTDGTLWALRNTGQSGGVSGADIRATSAWDLTTGSANVIVAVIDTGIRYTHQDLAANMWRNSGEIAGNGRDDDGNGYIDDVFGINSIDGSGNPMDDHSHGSHCAGTIGAVANGGGPHVGVAWNVRLMALKFLSANGSGIISNAIECVNYAVANGAHIMSNSWGGGGYSQSMRDAIAAANQRGILFVAAAGNDSTDNDRTPHYPSNYEVPNVVSVAATDRSNALASFSCYGRTTVHLGAPGVAIYSCTAASDTSYDSYNGTSMATPHVSGVAALIKARFPSATSTEIKQRLLASVTPIAALDGKSTTGGLLNADAALRMAADGVMEISAAPSVSPLPAGQPVQMQVVLTDLTPVLGATVSARFGSGASVTLRDNGSSPDATANDGIYTGSMTVPGGVSTVTLTVNASAPGKQAATRNFSFAVNSPPSNDNFASRRLLSAGTVTASGTNREATRETSEPRFPTVSGDRTVWWSWLAPSSGSFTITTSGSDFDTTLAIYSGTTISGLSLLGSNDDSSGLTSSVTFTAQAGVAYAVQVSGYSSAEGNIVLNYPSPGGAAAPIITQHPADVSVIVGSPFTISVRATGATSYQWYRNNVAISGATAQDYTISSSTLAQDGNYHAVVRNATGSSTSNSARVTINPVAVNPTNDNFADRQLLTGESGRVSANNSNATGETGEPNHANGSTPLNSVWFSWRAPSNGTVTFDTGGSNFDTTLAAYTGNTVNALTERAANDDSRLGSQSEIEFAVVGGTTYQIAVDGYYARTGEITLNYSFVPSAPIGGRNDNFANRQYMVSGATYSASNSNATGEIGEPNHVSRSTPLNSLWWQWTAPSNGTVVVSTADSDFDTTLAAYIGSSVSSLTEIDSNDDWSGLQSQIEFNAIAGRRYMIAVDGYGSARGNVRLRLEHTAVIEPPADFNGDGLSDIVWRHTATGQNVVWFMNGVTRGGHAALPGVAVASGWDMAGLGDFNSDSKVDILWRNSNTGQNLVWFMNGTTRTGAGSLPGIAPSTGWNIAGVGDFNADGKPDLVWRNANTGSNIVWYMNGTTRTGAGQLPTVAVNTGWNIAGVGDFNADGKPDLVWRNTSSGGNIVWFMNGATRSGLGQMPTVAAASGWGIQGIGDFNADNKPDLLWRNSLNGANGVWVMNGLTRIGASVLPSLANPRWRMHN